MAKSDPLWKFTNGHSEKSPSPDPEDEDDFGLTHLFRESDHDLDLQLVFSDEKGAAVSFFVGEGSGAKSSSKTTTESDESDGSEEKPDHEAIMRHWSSLMLDNGVQFCEHCMGYDHLTDFCNELAAAAAQDDEDFGQDDDDFGLRQLFGESAPDLDLKLVFSDENGGVVAFFVGEGSGGNSASRREPLFPFPLSFVHQIYQPLMGSPSNTTTESEESEVSDGSEEKPDHDAFMRHWTSLMLDNGVKFCEHCMKYDHLINSCKELPAAAAQDDDDDFGLKHLFGEAEAEAEEHDSEE